MIPIFDSAIYRDTPFRKTGHEPTNHLAARTAFRRSGPSDTRRSHYP
jgi:hypothetical protein